MVNGNYENMRLCHYGQSTLDCAAQYGLQKNDGVCMRKTRLLELNANESAPLLDLDRDLAPYQCLALPIGSCKSERFEFLFFFL